MQEIVLVIHLILTISLVILVLIQKSEGGALGIGGGQGGKMSGRGATTVLTRITTFLAVAFFITSLVLAVIAKQQTGDSSVFDDEEQAVEQPAPEDRDAPIIPEEEPVIPEEAPVMPETD